MNEGALNITTRTTSLNWDKQSPRESSTPLVKTTLVNALLLSLLPITTELVLWP